MKKITHEEVIKTIEGILAEFKPALEDIEFVVGISRGGLFPAMVVATAVAATAAPEPLRKSRRLNPESVRLGCLRSIERLSLLRVIGVASYRYVERN